MQSHSILTQAQNAASNAVLTPELIHPRYFLHKKRIPHAFRKNSAQIKVLPLQEKEIEFRKKWAQRQEVFIQHMPSTAVLGA